MLHETMVLTMLVQMIVHVGGYEVVGDGLVDEPLPSSGDVCLAL